MDPISTLPPIISQPVLPAQASSAPVIPAPVQVAQQQDQIDFSAQAAEQARYEAVQKAAHDVANVYVVSDQRFTIFKDATGQYITRFTNLRTGKVTYIPEPEMIKIGGNSSPAMIKISA